MNTSQTQNSDPNKTSKTIEVEISEESIIHLTNGETFVTSKYRVGVTGVFAVGTFEAPKTEYINTQKRPARNYSIAVFIPHTSIQYMDMDAAEKVREYQSGESSANGQNDPQNGGQNVAVG